MMQYPGFKCSKCEKTFFDDWSAGAESSICGTCRGKIKCEECGDWVDKINKKKLCDKCIPRYMKYPSVMAAISGEAIGDYYTGVSPDQKIEVLAGIVDCIIDKLPKNVADEILTYRKLSFEDNDEVFIKEEDKIE